MARKKIRKDARKKDNWINVRVRRDLLWKFRLLCMLRNMSMTEVFLRVVRNTVNNSEVSERTIIKNILDTCGNNYSADWGNVQQAMIDYLEAHGGYMTTDEFGDDNREAPLGMTEKEADVFLTSRAFSKEVTEAEQDEVVSEIERLQSVLDSDKCTAQEKYAAQVRLVELGAGDEEEEYDDED